MQNIFRRLVKIGNYGKRDAESVFVLESIHSNYFKDGIFLNREVVGRFEN